VKDNIFTQRVKALALELGADLVGIAPVERWNKAPIEHSPQGILPEAKSVVVCGIHTPDACIELGAEEDPRKPGPALGELDASSHLQFLAFRLAKYFQEEGWKAIPISQSGYWSYRPRKGAPRGWIADMSLYYAAVAAGLGEIGWHNICITPEFGTRQRFVAVITDAPLVPDPMYNGEPLCDRCLLCAKHCPTKAFDKEVSGECIVEIGGKEFHFPNRNLWRCAIGENFQLDVFLPWPDKIDEEVITEMAEKAAKEHPEWVYGWKMGMCFKYCVPPQRRYFDIDYCKSPRRRRDVLTEKNQDVSNRLMNEILALSRKIEVDIIGSADIASFKKEGINLKFCLPDAESAIVIGLGYPENCLLNTEFLARRAQLWIARHLEKYGFSALTYPELSYPELSPEKAALICGVAYRNQNGKVVSSRFGERQIWRVIVTSAPLPTLAKEGGQS
jgi:epoxyqueuosine reductase QueG